MSARRTLRPVAAGDPLTLLEPLRSALSGAGPALLPHADGAPAAPALTAGALLTEEEDDPDDPTALVVASSGSTGEPKGALLPASALLASASATHDRLGGSGRWLLALGAWHVAGAAVLVRSLVAGTTPVVLPPGGPGWPEAFAAAAARTRGVRRYCSLVPTQVVRLLDAGGAAVEALAGFDAVLVGGAAAPAPLLERAAAAGARLVPTYGMSETCGGCVYDGVPLDGVRADVAADGRVSLAGAVVARGYRGRPRDPAFTTTPDRERRFTTDDAGRWDGGRLVVVGRVDDVVVTGGVKVAPRPVEEVLAQHPAVAEAVVVGVPDAEWGERVVAVVVPRGTTPDLGELRSRVTERLGTAAAPRQLVVVEALPLRGPGKPDRAALRALAQAEGPAAT